MQDFVDEQYDVLLGSHIFFPCAPINNDDQRIYSISDRFSQIFRYPGFSFTSPSQEKPRFCLSDFSVCLWTAIRSSHQSHFKGCPTIKDFDDFAEIRVGEVVQYISIFRELSKYISTISQPDQKEHFIPSFVIDS